MGEPDQPPLRVLSSAADIEGLDDLEVIQHFVPEWKAAVHLRQLSADASIKLAEEVKAVSDETPHDSMFVVLAACISDSEGKPLFESAEQARKILGKRRPDPLVALQEKAMGLLGWTKTAEAALKNVSGEAAGASSPTG